jgi:hypothetical protein
MAAARSENPRERVVEVAPEPTPQTPEETGTPSETPGAEQTTSPQEGEQPGRGVITKMICPTSGLLAGPYCPDPREVSYDLSAGAEPPSRTCDVHKTPGTGPQRAEGRRERPPAAQGDRVTLSVCAITGKLATPYCPIVVTRSFPADQAPTETCTRHRR